MRGARAAGFGAVHGPTNHTVRHRNAAAYGPGKRKLSPWDKAQGGLSGPGHRDVLLA
jgi:hypothetical protein